MVLTVPKRKLGELEVPCFSLGCMGMSEFYGKAEEKESIATIHRSVEFGVNFLDTADVYGQTKNEILVGKAIQGIRDKIILATKFGVVRGPDGAFTGINGRPEYVKVCCEGSLKRLGVETIDLYYFHRIDPDIPIEETAGAMSELVKEGKVRFIGLSEAAPATIRRAHAVIPVTALQTEYSLWSRDPEDEILQVTRELGIGFVAYSPLGRGFLTGRLKSFDDLAEDDYRRSSPRFMGENFDKNLKLVEEIQNMARVKGVQASQLALAWLLSRGDDIVPLFGTKRRVYLEENIKCLDIKLTKEDCARLEAIAPKGAAAGNRYNEWGMSAINK